MHDHGEAALLGRHQRYHLARALVLVDQQWRLAQHVARLHLRDWWPHREVAAADNDISLDEALDDVLLAHVSDRTAVEPYDPGRPCEIKVEFKTTEAARKYARKAGVEQLDERAVVSRGDDWWSAWKQFFF